MLTTTHLTAFFTSLEVQNSILNDPSPRPDGTLTLWEEKARLALPILREQFSQTRSFEQDPTRDLGRLMSWLGSHWAVYPEPSKSFIKRER